MSEMPYFYTLSLQTGSKMFKRTFAVDSDGSMCLVLGYDNICAPNELASKSAGLVRERPNM